MKTKLFAVLITLISVPVLPQTESDIVDEAKRGFAESQYKVNGERFRSDLAKNNLSSEKVEETLLEAIDDFASCMVDSAKQQAEEQGLPVHIVLDAIGGKGLNDEQVKIVMNLDTESMRERTEVCRRALGNKLGIEIHEDAA